MILDSTTFWAGYFDSIYKFQDVSITTKRQVACYEIEVYSNGGGTTFINDVPIEIRPGKIVCAKPNDIRYSHLPFKCYYLKIAPTKGKALAFLETLPTVICTEKYEALIALIKDIIISEEANDELTGNSRFFAFLSLLKSEGTQSLAVGRIPPGHCQEAVELALDYIDEHYGERCSLRDIARASHLSPVYFHGIFKAAIGKTPFEYLINFRLEEAKRMLLTENTDLGKISASCGFTSQSYFSHTFRKRFGETPSAFRQRMIAKYTTLS